MENIKILEITSKTTKTNKPYKMCKVECAGETRQVNIWSNAPDFANLAVGSIIVGKMAKEGEYWNISFEGDKPRGGASGAFRTAQMEKVMEKKEASISKFQDNREHSVKVAATMRDAVLIATSLTPDQWQSTTMQEEVRFWREWLWNEYDNVGSDTMKPF